MMGGMVPGPGVRTYGTPLPPYHEDLLAWVKGNTTDDTRVDSYTDPGQFDMDLVESPCLQMALTDTGSTATNHGTIVSSGGTAVLSYDGATITVDTVGTCWRIEFSDSTIFPLAERSSTVANSFSTDGSYSISWSTTNLAGLRSGRQDEYHFNTSDGWWEITGDDTKYPYAVAGFDTHHSGSTWNQSEVKQIFKERGVATFTLTDTVTTIADHGSIVSYNGTSTPAYDGTTLSVTIAGTLYDVLFSDGTLLTFRDGEYYGNTTTDIRDSDGVIRGQLNSSNVADVWANTRLYQQLIDMDAAWNFFTNTDGKPLVISESDFDELGGEVLENGSFATDLTGWIPATATLTWVAGTIKVDAAGSSQGAYLVFPTETGKTYRATGFSTSASTDHLLRISNGASPTAGIVNSIAKNIPSEHSVTFVAESGTSNVYLRCNVSGIVYWDNISVREVNPIINNNNQYYYNDAFLGYDRVMTVEEDLVIKAYLGL